MLDTVDQYRLAASESLIAMTRLTMPGYVVNWHHELIADALEWAARTPHARLIITMPPRHGKSELASVRFAPWLMATRPELPVVVATYNNDFAEDFGRKAREVMQSPEYGFLFPRAGLKADNRSVARWSTDNGGSYYAVGVGGSLTGRGAGMLLIDDPHKNREEAESEAARKKVWDWYRSTAYTRLEQGGRVVIIMTRWHEKDLVGQVLAQPGENWRVLSLPAIAEEDDEHRKAGEALWPGKYTAEVLGVVRSTVGEREWSALYQQHPTPLKGTLFKPDRLKVIDAAPAGTKWVRGWDFGGGEDAEADPTAGGLLGVTKEGRFVIGDMVHDRLAPEGVEAVLVATASRDGKETTVNIPQDPGQAGKAQVQYLTKKLAGYRVKSSPETGSKTLRAEPLAAQLNVGNVDMVRGSWNEPLMEELRTFPNGANDDRVDALSRAFSTFVEPRTTGIIDYLQQLRDEAEAKKKREAETEKK